MERSRPQVHIDGRNVTPKSGIKLNQGEYYGTDGKLKVRYYRFYFPFSSDVDGTELDHYDNVFSDMEWLIQDGKVDTTLIW